MLKNVFEQNFKNIRSPLNNASFGSFWVPIGQLFEPHWVFEKLSQMRYFDVFESKTMPIMNFLG